MDLNRKMGLSRALSALSAVVMMAALVAGGGSAHAQTETYTVTNPPPVKPGSAAENCKRIKAAGYSPWSYVRFDGIWVYRPVYKEEEDASRMSKLWGSVEECKTSQLTVRILKQQDQNRREQRKQPEVSTTVDQRPNLEVLDHRGNKVIATPVVKTNTKPQGEVRERTVVVNEDGSETPVHMNTKHGDPPGTPCYPTPGKRVTNDAPQLTCPVAPRTWRQIDALSTQCALRNALGQGLNRECRAEANRFLAPEDRYTIPTGPTSDDCSLANSAKRLFGGCND